MLIDSHCHIDLYKNPMLLLKECETSGLRVIAMTNLPSHFEMGVPFFRIQKNIRLALGMHPLYSEKHNEEFPTFLRNLSKTSYIGEIGLDFSKDGISTKDIQISTFTKILENVSNKQKILSIHSRGAEEDVFKLLVKYNIQNAIFHWYSGSTSLISKILGAGYFFSINPSMITSENGKRIISQIPNKRILTESDGPFVQFRDRIIHPKDVRTVIDYISKTRKISNIEIERQIQDNFNEMINKIK
jgi:TatD DNase family protein